jgi:thiamine transport system permease protein
MPRPGFNGPLVATWLLAGAPLLFLALGLLVPVTALFNHVLPDGIGLNHTLQDSGSANAWADIWQDDYLRWRVLWTLLQATVTCVMSLLLGLPLAWLLARLAWPGRTLLLKWVMLPFVVPSTVAALGILALWGHQGWLNWAIPWPAPGQGRGSAPWLLLYGNLFFNLSVVIKAGVEGLQAVSASQVAAARSLGASQWRAFWRVEWPALLPRLSGALCLVFIYSFGGFGLALILGGQRYATLEVEIYTLVAHELDLAGAGRLATISFALLSLGVALQSWLGLHLRAPSRQDAITARPPKGTLEFGAVAIGWTLIMLVCIAPIIAVIAKAFVAGPTAAALLDQPETWLALGNTLGFSGAALAIATGLGVSFAFAAFHFKWLRPMLLLPLVVSPITIGFGYLVAYPGLTANRVLLVAAYALMAMPMVSQSVLAGLDALPRPLAQAARSLGASRWRTFTRVTLPLLIPSLRRGMAFALATCLGEFAVTLFLSRPEWATLGTLIYQHLGRPGQANLDAAMLLSALLLALTLVLFGLINGRSSSNLR